MKKELLEQVFKKMADNQLIEDYVVIQRDSREFGKHEGLDIGIKGIGSKTYLYIPIEFK